MNRFSIIVLLCLYTTFKIAENQTTFDCTEAGFFEIVDGTCKNYLLCVDDGANLVPVILSCASNSIFDPVQGRCVCQCTNTCQQSTTMAPSTTASSTTAPSTTAPSTTSAPLCVRYGRFPIQDVNCKSYYLCYWNGSSYTIMDNLSCPNTLVFNPETETCVSPQTFTCSGTSG